jgi:transposase
MNNVDSIRLEQFRQIRREVRGSSEYLIIGIDVAKEKNYAFFGTATGKVLLRRLIFENNLEGFEKLRAVEDSLKDRYGLEKVIYGVEPTGNYHKPLGEHLIKCCRNVVLVSGVAVKNNRKMVDCRWDKNDTKDAAVIADLMSQGKFLFYEYTSMPIRDLRNLLSLKRRLKKQEQVYKVRIRNSLIAQYFPEFDRYFSSRSKEGLAIIRWCLDPSVIAGLEYDEFVRSIAPGDRCSILQRKRLREVWKIAIESVGCSIGESMDVEAKLMVEGLKHVRGAIMYVEKEVEKICKSIPEYEYIVSIPGFGPDISSKVVAAIGFPNRFDNGRQVLKMAGMDLSASRSGNKSDNVTPQLSKSGKADLRYALYQAALIASYKNEYFKRYYTEKLRGREKEKGINTKMRVKLAAKMLIIAWTLMKKQKYFDPGYMTIE